MCSAEDTAHLLPENLSKLIGAGILGWDSSRREAESQCSEVKIK